MPGTYQYEPGNIAEYGKDRMRFELGDVMVEGKEKTCALCDEEYNAVLPEKIPTTRQVKHVAGLAAWARWMSREDEK